MHSLMCLAIILFSLTYWETYFLQLSERQQHVKHTKNTIIRMDDCILQPQKLHYLLKHNVINTDAGRGFSEMQYKPLLQNCNLPSIYPLMSCQSSIQRKKEHDIGSSSDLVLISQPLNAPFLFNNLVLPLLDELFNCLLWRLCRKGGLIFPPSVLGEVLLMCVLGVECWITFSLPDAQYLQQTRGY